MFLCNTISTVLVVVLVLRVDSRPQNPTRATTTGSSSSDSANYVEPRFKSNYTVLHSTTDDGGSRTVIAQTAEASKQTESSSGSSSSRSDTVVDTSKDGKEIRAKKFESSKLAQHSTTDEGGSRSTLAKAEQNSRLFAHASGLGNASSNSSSHYQDIITTGYNPASCRTEGSKKICTRRGKSTVTRTRTSSSSSYSHSTPWHRVSIES